MMRWLILMVVAVLSAAPAAARNEKPIKDYASALFSSMNLHWTCRNYLGVASYESAKNTAISGLAKYVGPTDAKSYVGEMDRRFRADSREAPTSLAGCQRVSADRLRQIEIEKSKLEE
jgi:hypothetical protein